jgi:type IV pilus assembly protein PilM
MTHDRLSLWRAQPPSVAVEFTSTRVSAARVEIRAGQAVVSAHATEALPAGALTPSLTSENLQEPEVVRETLDRVLTRVGRPRRVGLVLPDAVAKVSVIRFEQVPARGADLDQLIKWQVRKAAPFAIEEAQVSYLAGTREEHGHNFIVTLARREVIKAYEGLCAAAGAHAGLVDISTFNVINAVLAGAQPPSADWLLVNVTPDYASIAILRGSYPIFFRSRAASTDETLSDLVHQTAMYYEDRLQGTGFGEVLLSGSFAAGGGLASELEAMRRSLESRLTATVSTVDPRAAAKFADRAAVVAPDLLDTLTPLVGLLVRHRGAAA